jgi:xylulose-5-phosphate/fructose-6-phosphate phosphoketolase
VAVVVGDGEAETGPLATAWHSNKFLNPVRDGAVLPILHLNGYKINNPTCWRASRHEELDALFRGYGWTPYFVEGRRPGRDAPAMAATLERCFAEIRRIQREARARQGVTRPRWPMIVLRSPKGWTGRKGRRQEGGGLLARPPGADRRRARQSRQLEAARGLAASYRPEELFDASGRLVESSRAGPARARGA